MPIDDIDQQPIVKLFKKWLFLFLQSTDVGAPASFGSPPPSRRLVGY